MPALSATARQILAAKDKDESAELIDRAFGEIEGLREAKVHWGNPDHLNSDERSRAMVVVLLQASVHRMSRLLRSVGAVIEQHDPYGLVLITRGALETTCQIGYFCERFDALQKGNITRERLAELLSAALAGTKVPNPVGREVQPISVLSYIEKADKFYAAHIPEGAPVGFLRTAYDDLSEVCHPNFSSSASSFWIDNEAHDFVFKHDDELDNLSVNNVHLVAITALCFVSFIREFLDRMVILDN